MMYMKFTSVGPKSQHYYFAATSADNMLAAMRAGNIDGFRLESPDASNAANDSTTEQQEIVTLSDQWHGSSLGLVVQVFTIADLLPDRLNLASRPVMGGFVEAALLISEAETETE